MRTIVLCIGNMIIRKMDTAPRIKEFIDSFALPDDCLVLHYVWYLGRNVLPINQNRLVVCLQGTFAIQFWCRTPGVTIGLHSFKGIVSNKSACFRYQLQVLSSPRHPYFWPTGYKSGVPSSHEPFRFIFHQNNLELRKVLHLGLQFYYKGYKSGPGKWTDKF